VGIIVGENTKLAAPDYAYLELDKVRVKGKDLPITIYKPIGLLTAITPEQRIELEQFDQALTAYRNQDWDSAESKLYALNLAHPERKVYGLYCERIAHFRSEPPPKYWDGVLPLRQNNRETYAYSSIRLQWRHWIRISYQQLYGKSQCINRCWHWRW
jgi:adenylate cyclase